MWFLIIFMAALATLLYGQEIQSRCNAPTVRKGEEALITCNFSEDVRRGQNAFVVKHIAFGKDEMVLACQWKDGKEECHVRPTYVFDGTITDTIQIFIPGATEDHVGIYACHVIQEEPKFTICTFNLTVIESECEASAVDQSQCATITCKFNHDLRENHYQISVKHFAEDKDENVMLCQWTNGNEDCYLRPTYEFHGNISNQLTIEIPRVTQDHNGEYMCFVLPAEPEHVKPCKLVTKDYITTTPIIYTSVIYHDQCVNCTIDSKTMENNSSLIWLCFLLVLIPIIIGLVIIVIRRTSCQACLSTKRNRSLGEKKEICQPDVIFTKCEQHDSLDQ